MRVNRNPRNMIWSSAVFDVLDDLVDGQAELRPDLLGEEPVAHAVTGVDTELLTLVPLGLA